MSEFTLHSNICLTALNVLARLRMEGSSSSCLDRGCTVVIEHTGCV